ncbi:MAG: FCD domain-containing protein [Pseudomonadota bacterium]
MAEAATIAEDSSARRLFEDIANLIRHRIEIGDLKEGDKLPTERELASSLGYSRNTVREALRALEHAGLLEQRPGVLGGAFVRSSGAEVIRTAFEDLVRLKSIRPVDLIEVRMVIGREMVRLASERMDADDLEALEENFRQMEAAAQAEDQPLRVSHSLAFHKLLARASRNPVLIIITDVLTGITMEFVRNIGPAANTFAVESQRRMLDDLRSGRTESAMAEMDLYLRTTLVSYFDRA